MARVLLLLLSLGFLLSSCVLFNKKVPEYKITMENMVEIKESRDLDSYGFNKYRYQVREGKVKRNESLYLILRDMDISPQTIYDINRQSDDLFQSNRVKPGQKYFAYIDRNTDKPVRLVLHKDALEYVVFDWEDDINVSVGRKEITTEIVTTEGVISSSLYESLLENDNDLLLGNSLSEIFAWQVDFFRLYPGDNFKVIYEKQYIDGRYYGLGKVLAAEFEHKGEVFDAFYYEDEERAGYFDSEGNGVQKALMKAPFKFSQRISSGFTHNRFHPVLKRSMPHYGVDYAAPLGTPVLAVGDGEIVESRYRGANGNIVKIRHNATYTTAYLHLNGFAKGIKEGVRVKQGQVIGYVGKSGRVTGVHLDYRIYKNGSPVNPLTVKLPPSKSIADSNMEEFNRIVQLRKSELNTPKAVDQVVMTRAAAQ
ncbi:peptidoglycan DD-metalloendopeptidase family protein [Gracilimonas aurantiaca]|uniref:peptidoglycan DD-metalloendopeptidase family protein n=1 Tax=Gracilimonas aurantiaca TaxID=3234185 RepID=UPI00390C9201